MPPRRRSDVDGLADRERLAVNLLARGKTNREVAQTIGVTERTVYAWRQRLTVQRAIFEQQQELIDTSQGQGINVIPEAMQTLVSIMNDPDARPADRIAASRALINGAHAYQERKLLERTISDLEHQLYGRLEAVTEEEFLPEYDAEAEAERVASSNLPEFDDPLR